MLLIMRAQSKNGRLQDPEGKEWRFWLPLIMLFMGLRPREVLQLGVSDLQQTPAGVWFLNLRATSDEGDDFGAAEFAKSLKTNASRRQVAVHPELTKIGLLQFFNEQREKKKRPHLFLGLRANRYGDPAWYPLKRFREVYLPAAIKLKPLQTVYSFRHTWRDALRRVGASADALKAVGGWGEAMTTSDAYGSKLHPDLYAPVIEAVAYPGLDLSHLWQPAANAGRS